jgi:hypothetical protein
MLQNWLSGTAGHYIKPIQMLHKKCQQFDSQHNQNFSKKNESAEKNQKAR